MVPPSGIPVARLCGPGHHKLLWKESLYAFARQLPVLSVRLGRWQALFLKPERIFPSWHVAYMLMPQPSPEKFWTNALNFA
jgi:hypothetical protein